MVQPLSTAPVGDLALIGLWTARFLRQAPAMGAGLEERIQSRRLRSPVAADAGAAPVPRISPAEMTEGGLAPYLDRCPVVIEGLLSHTPAVRDWSLDWFARQLGDFPVHYSDYLRDGGEEKIAVMAERIPLHQAIADLRVATGKAVRSCADIVRANPHLLSDLGTQALSGAAGVGITHTDVWMAAGGNITPFHCAGGGNLFCMIHGQKRWSLVSPEQTPLMYPEIGRLDHLLYVNSALPGTPAPELDALTGFPLFHRARRLEVTLNPGDVLYNPPWWWHQVENLGETIGVAQRLKPTAYLPDRFSMLMYALCVASRPRIMLAAARGAALPDDVLHLADHRKGDPAWRTTSSSPDGAGYDSPARARV